MCWKWWKSFWGGKSKSISVVSNSLRKNQPTAETTIDTARGILLQEGPAKALEWLKVSPYVGSEPVIRMMHALVWNNRHVLPQGLLSEEFLDPIWCQCSICNSTWLTSPLLSNYQTISISGGDIQSLECSSCGLVLCTECAKAAYSTCRCGGTFSNLRQPNGRKRLNQPTVEKEEWDWHPLPPDEPLDSDKNLHLYFGFEGRVPIGVDPTFPSKQIGTPNDHIAWAETLVDVGLFYQAKQQLDVLSELDASSPRDSWLRARIELIRLHNARERSKRRLDTSFGELEWWKLPDKIKQWLIAATEQLPEFGPAWLTTAQVYLDPYCGQDFERALQYARRAQELLGDTDAVLSALGQALHGVGHPSEASAVLRTISKDSDTRESLQKERELAELEAHCQSEPLDIEAHLRLGRLYLRHEQREKAQHIFTKLLNQCPEHAEGYYGLAKLAFLDFDKPQEMRYTEAHRLCREALTRNPNFGLAYELLGSILRSLRFGMATVDFPIEDPIKYYQRAIQLDSTCDVALWVVAEDYIDRGQLQPAIELLEQAAALDTNMSSVYFILATVYKGTRQFEKQDWAYRKAKELSPDTELSNEYQNKILELCGFEY
ncbi:MAG: tetratricopeptide repeat protein [Deltaproteobacteria bacterium]|nr:tetratricopeptide repeat protein [Deltaproteobacteria bacterium]